jgi:hypothetical protein
MKTVDSLSYSYSCCSILSYHVTLSVAIPLSRGRGCSCNGGCAGLYRAVLYFNSNQIKSNQTVTLVIVVVMVMGGEICDEHGSGWGVE